MMTADSARAPTTFEPELGPGRWTAVVGDVGASGRGGIVAAHESGRGIQILGEPGPSASTAGENGVGVVFDGAIYNRSELIAQLGSAPPIRSDADLVLRAWQKWGDDLMPKLEGIFALVVWDGNKEVLLGARDRMGHYPLFFADLGEEIVFSLSVDAVLEHPRVSRDPNRALMAEHRAGLWHSREETYFTQVRRALPGHITRWSASSRQVERYWNPARGGVDADWIREDFVDRFDEAFQQAVNRSLAFGPSGIFLSGGLDSVSVAAVAVEQSRARGLPSPWGLSVIFPHPSCNEEMVQRGVGERLGIPHHLVTYEAAIGGKGPMAAALELSRSLPAPLMSLWQPAYMHLAEQGRARGCRTILTGMGGDEWLIAGPALAADLLRGLNFAGFLRFYMTAVRSYQRSPVALFRNLLWTSGLRPLLSGVGGIALQKVAPRRLAERRGRRRARLLPPYIAPDPSLRRQVLERVAQNEPEPRVRDFYQRHEQMGLDNPVNSMEAEEFFECNRRTGTRQFPVYLDPDMVDTLRRMPPEVLNRGGRTKGLVRESLARSFPHLGFERQKKVLAADYYVSLIRQETATAWNSVGHVPTLAKLGIVDREGLSRLVENVNVHTEAPAASRIWPLLSLEAWAQARF